MISVGASSLAINLRSPRGVRLCASSLTIIASKLAPTNDPYKSGVRVALSVFAVKEKPSPRSADRLVLETVLKRLPCRAGP
ncbi:hypothetical protein D3C76_1517180 [compost metagenome]